MVFEGVYLLLHAGDEGVSRLGVAGEEEDIVLRSLDFLLEVLVHADEFLTVGHALHALGEVRLCGSAFLLERLSCALGSLALGVEEGVACFAELLPEVVGELTRYGSYFLPLLLEGDEGIGGLFPLGAVLQLLGACEQFAFLAEVLVEHLLHLFVEGALCFEEGVAQGAVLLVDSLVAFLWCEADGAPFGLEGLHLLGSLVPLLVGFQIAEVQCFELLHDGLLLGEILRLLGVELVEVGLVLLVDDGGSGFEAVPEVFAQFTRYGSYLCPLVVQLLECTACLHYGGVLLQFLCCLTEQGLHLEVLLEVQVAQLDVYLDEVVELLLVLLVEFPNLLRVGGGNLSDGLPLGLEVAHLLEVAHHVGGL